MFGLFRSWRRSRLAKRPFPPEWEAIVQERMPRLFAGPREDADRLRTILKVFALEKHWIGAGDLVVTDEMKVVISAVAAELAGGLALDAYDRLTEIVIYPSHYKHPDKDGVVFGEAHTWGTVVLSWDAVEHGIANPNDGHNTALHEFAHVLDIADGAFDGTPVFRDSAAIHGWAKACARSFVDLRRAPHKNVVRKYGATNEAEFFACATEAFFEKPRKLREKAPELYGVLKKFYKVDPAARK